MYTLTLCSYPMLTTSQDVLNLSLALSAIGLAILLGWLFIYLILILRPVVRIMSKLEKTLDMLEKFINQVKEKLESSTAYLSVLALGAKQLINFLTNLAATTGKKPNRPPPKGKFI